MSDVCSKCGMVPEKIRVGDVTVEGCGLVDKEYFGPRPSECVGLPRLKKMQMAWLKYRDENESSFESEEDAVYETWVDGYRAGEKK